MSKKTKQNIILIVLISSYFLITFLMLYAISEYGCKEEKKSNCPVCSGERKVKSYYRECELEFYNQNK